MQTGRQSVGVLGSHDLRGPCRAGGRAVRSGALAHRGQPRAGPPNLELPEADRTRTREPATILQRRNVAGRCRAGPERTPRPRGIAPADSPSRLAAKSRSRDDCPGRAPVREARRPRCLRRRGVALERGRPLARGRAASARAKALPRTARLATWRPRSGRQRPHGKPPAG